VLWRYFESCRSHSDAPASVFVSFAHDQVTVLAGEIAQYTSSPMARWLWPHVSP
jgi:hypothetical protein